MITPTRRHFLRQTTATLALAAASRPAVADTAVADPQPEEAPGAGSGTKDLHSRIHGLLVGTALGDAFGGPIEFQAPADVQRLPTPPKIWRDDEILDDSARRATRDRLRLRRYQDLRPTPESYAHWNENAAPGTVTDDTRHKLVLLRALHGADQSGNWPLDRTAYARTHLEWASQSVIASKPAYAALAADWLEEWQFAARWILGDREPSRARPPERMWQGLPTCSGQMSLLPLAAIHAGHPDRAYRAAYHLGFFDNGYGKDLNAALVAALAVALTVDVDPSRPGDAWRVILDALRRTDPYQYGAIRWTTRSVDRWLDRALSLVKAADRRPARLFAGLEREFKDTTKWEAQVPFTVAFACLALADYDPLAALQLSLEWGHDTDSYAQVVGAFIGALHGPGLFAPEWTRAVSERLHADFDVVLAEESRFLATLHARTRDRELIAER
ncbi:MAG: ADP-ribosylglycohydrolase family protein [Limisphaerales bacterium]